MSHAGHHETGRDQNSRGNLHDLDAELDRYQEVTRVIRQTGEQWLRARLLVSQYTERHPGKRAHRSLQHREEADGNPQA